MKMYFTRIESPGRWRLLISEDLLLGISFIAFFSKDFVRTIIRYALKMIGIRSNLDLLTLILSLMIMYVPIMVLCIKSKKYIAFDFIFILIIIISLFCSTLYMHPEYEYWYSRHYYGVWDYVLRPDNGLYFYLFIILIDDSEKLFKYLKIASVIMLAYYTYKFIPFLKNGYWEIRYIETGEVQREKYNLEYGYNVLVFALIYSFSAMYTRKLFDWGMALLGLFLVVFGGSRGAVLCIFIFFGGYFFISLEGKKDYILRILLVFSVGLLLLFSYKYILIILKVLFNKIGVGSRFFDTLLNGSVGDDNGRDILWEATINMIKKKPFGYGIMGTRHVLSQFHTAAYPHNVFLELIADYGVLVGGGMCLLFLYNTAKILFMKNIPVWKGLFWAFFSFACQLLLSATIYHRGGFWGALAIATLIFRHNRSEKNTIMESNKCIYIKK